MIISHWAVESAGEVPRPPSSMRQSALSVVRPAYTNPSLLLTCMLFLCVEVFSQELPCAVDPIAIRAYSVATSNSICLVWPTNAYRTSLLIARRIYTNRPSAWQNWKKLYTNSDSATVKQASQYCDTSVTSGVHYEYAIAALTTNWICDGVTNRPAWSYQYINSGNYVPLKDTRGKLILLVESSLATQLATELTTLTYDLTGDGYQVYRHDIAASDVTEPGWKSKVANTKTLIRSDYHTDTNADWSIFIVGHVPIPYSGLSSPGSHTENYGAHPADWYYADMDEAVWTETTANDSTASYASNWNIPGDGKFDQSFVPSAPELRIGRIDLRNMPAFGKSEVELMRQYLNRDHAWRHKQFIARDRGLVNSNNNHGLIYEGRPFESHSLYSSFFGNATSTDLGSWLDAAITPASSYLFAASSGNGLFTQDMQIGTTADFAATPLYAVFTSMYGSYYGDWDSAMHPDIVLQAPLAAEGYVVCNYYHENVMNIDAASMGEPVGEELFAMASNFFPAFDARYVQFGYVYEGQTYLVTQRPYNYVTLLGDPTLRERVVAPPANVEISASGADNVLSWTAASDVNIQGYHVYRSPMTNENALTRMTSVPVDGGVFRDADAAGGAYRYMVRSVKLEQSASRSYYNASQGIFATTVLRPRPPSNLRVVRLSSP